MMKLLQCLRLVKQRAALGGRRLFCNTTVPLNKPKGSPLAKHLYQQIRFSGPLSVAEYMRICLTHPQYGYYTSHPNIFGAAGDFVTAPHVTPVFSQLLGVWIANHVTTTSMRDFELIELGPGTGRLLTDLLPTVQKLRASPASLTLFEASSELRQVQSKALATLSNAPKPRWASTLSEALDNPNEQPVIIIAHEFFDALPVHVLHKVPSKTGTESQWREQLVDIVEDPNPGEPQFRFVLSRAATPAVALAQSVCTIQPQTDSKVLEVCADGMSTARRLAELIHRRGGAALIIDYGSDTLRGNTVRALSKHAITDVLASPGESDITADVNFGHLRHAVSGVPSMRLWSSISQREFLLRLGAAERFRMIARSVVATDESDEEIDNRLLRLQQDYDRIVGVGEQNMGTVYKVAVIANEKEGVPFGFANRSG